MRWSNLNGYNHTTFPNQKLTEREKKKEYDSVEEWAIANIEAIEHFCSYYSGWNKDTRYDKEKMKKNLELVEEGFFEASDYDNMLKPYGKGAEYNFPATLSHYDIISPKIELLKGEESVRPFNWVVANKSVEGVNHVMEEKKKMNFELIKRFFLMELQKLIARDGGDPNQINLDPEGIARDDEGNPLESFKDIEKYFKYRYSDLAEKVATDSLKYLIYDTEFTYWCNRNFIKFLSTGFEVYWVGDYNGEPSIRIIDPRFFDCDISGDSDFIDDCGWCREVEYLVASEVYDRYYELLDEEDIESIEGQKGFLYDSNTGSDDYNIESVKFMGGNSIIRVAHFEWKSLKKIGVVITKDPNNEEAEEKYVDEYYKKEPGEEVTWMWVNERWEGIKIADNIYIGIRPLPSQYDDPSNLSLSQSRYIGVRGEYCFVDKIVPYQYLYNAIMYQLKMALSRAKGRGFIMDVSQIPMKKGWDVDKWLYYLDIFGIGFIDSTQMDERGQRPSFNQFQTFDMTLGDSIQHYISQLDFIKREVADITGISPQREGAINPHETLGGVERSVTQSAAITESLFYIHTECKKRVLQRLLDVAKKSWKIGKKITYILDDVGRKFFEVSEDFKASSFGLFISNSGEDNKALQLLRQLAQVSLQAKEITLKDFISLSKSKSLAEVEHILKDAEEYNQKKQQDMQSQASQQQQQAEQAKLEAEQKKLNMEYEKKMEIEKLKSQTSIDVAKINAESKVLSFRTDMDGDINDNGILDMIESEKVRLEREKLRTETGLKEKELSLKQQEIENNSKKEQGQEAGKQQTMQMQQGAEQQKMQNEIDLENTKHKNKMEQEKEARKTARSKPKSTK